MYACKGSNYCLISKGIVRLFTEHDFCELPSQLTQFIFLTKSMKQKYHDSEKKIFITCNLIHQVYRWVILELNYETSWNQ